MLEILYRCYPAVTYEYTNEGNRALDVYYTERGGGGWGGVGAAKLRNLFITYLHGQFSTSTLLFFLF